MEIYFSTENTALRLQYFMKISRFFFFDEKTFKNSQSV